MRISQQLSWLAILAAVSLLGAVRASPALAASPWWQLASSAAPTDLVPGTGTDEVQEITVSATGGHFALERDEERKELDTAPLPWDATHEEVQTALEAAGVYGAGNVVVAGGPEGGVLKPYTVTFVKAFAHMRVVRIHPQPEEGGTLTLTGGEQRVTVAERALGKPAGKITLTASNIGDQLLNATEGTPVNIVDTLPVGLTATAVRGEAGPGREGEGPELEPYEELGTLTVCHILPGSQAREVECSYDGMLPPFQSIRVEIALAVASVAPGAVNQATVTWPGSTPASVAQPVTANGAPTSFGLEDNEVTPEQEGGAPDTQAGSHPFQTTFSIAVNKNLAPGPEEVDLREEKEEEIFGNETSVADPKAVDVNLPPGAIGNPSAVAQCTDQEFAHVRSFFNACPTNTVVGAAIVTISHAQEGPLEAVHTVSVPLDNLVPGEGEPARLGFDVFGTAVLIDTALRSGRDYAVVSQVSNISEIPDLISSKVVLWGTPGDPRHHDARGYPCLKFRVEACEHQPEEADPQPFFTLPGSCDGPLRSSVEAVSWGEAAEGAPLTTFAPTKELVSLTGCDKLPFDPSIVTESSTTSANAPTALAVHVHVPQEASTDPNGLAEADVRNSTVALPAGLQVNPAAAAGLKACSEQQVGFERLEPDGEAVFSEETEQERHGEAPHQECPEASKVGKVTITTPLLPEPLTGWAYEASQGANPFGSLLALYVVAEDKQAGVRVRLAGEVKVQSDGQLVTSIRQTPQTPFEEFTLETFGDNKGPLATTGCGAYKTEGSIEPWSGTPPVALASEIDVSSGCTTSPEPFVPGFQAGTTNVQAGAYSPFTLTLTRTDSEQTLSTLSTTMPPGLLGNIKAVPQCGEAEANAGTCPAASQIGHVRVSSGVGSEPVSLPEAGRREDPVYLTGPYGGGPFGLSIVVHPEAGPFNLEENGHPVIVRARISINPVTSQVSVVSEPMPIRLRGIPVDVRRVEVTIERPGGVPFEFNPTSCAPMSVAATIGSSEGASEDASSRFQVANCTTLPFKPSFSASTQAKTSKEDGASLIVKIQAHQGPDQPAGQKEPNILKVDTQLPLALSSRLTTLQRACTEKQFATNPASCPKEAAVGTAVAHTPVLPVPLEGPAYLVSHGGAEFPDLVLVLQGDGVAIDLTGLTDIKHGITYSKFETTPDAPIESFELRLPEGKFSILGVDTRAVANQTLCRPIKRETVSKKETKRVRGKLRKVTVKVTENVATTLTMPTTITAQDGSVLKQETKIAVTGCPEPKSVARPNVARPNVTKKQK